MGVSQATLATPDNRNRSQSVWHHLAQEKHAQPERNHREVFRARRYLGIRRGPWLRAIWIAPSQASGSTPRSSEPCRAGHAQCA
jgi:hypothetical protein